MSVDLLLFSIIILIIAVGLASVKWSIDILRTRIERIERYLFKKLVVFNCWPICDECGRVHDPNATCK